MAKPLPYHLTDFLEYCEVEQGLTATTVKNYARFLRRFFQWLSENNLEHLEPQDLTPQHVARYRIWLSRLPNAVRKDARDLKVSTQVRYLIALRNLLAYFHEHDIPTLPTEKIRLPKERERVVRFLTTGQLKEMFDAVPAEGLQGLRDRAILETLFSTGVRVAELTSLDRRQITDAAGNDADIIADELEMTIVGKGGKPRPVYLSARAAQWVRRYLQERTDIHEALFIRLAGPKDAPLRMTVSSIERIVEKYAARSGISFHATPHTLRHTFATYMLERGADLRTVQEFLGHKNIATTQVYTHVTNRRLRDLHKKLHSDFE